MGADVRPDAAALGAVIERLRVEQGLSRRDMGMDVGYLGKIERGERRPQPPTLSRIARRLGTTPADLLARAGELLQSAETASRLVSIPFSSSSGLRISSAHGGSSGPPTLQRRLAALARVVGVRGKIRSSKRHELIAALQAAIDVMSDADLGVLVAILEGAFAEGDEMRPPTNA